MRVRVRRQRRATLPAWGKPRGTGQRGRGVAGATPASLEVGGALDPAERAADRLAARVLGAGAAQPGAVAPAWPAAHRMCIDCAAERSGGKEKARRAPAAATTLAPGTTAAPAPRAAAAALAGLGAGSPLAPAERCFFEPRFGLGLGGVRLHDGPDADRAARALDARAFTRGEDIGFAAGAFDRPTLAHELAHVVNGDGHTRRQVPAPAPAMPPAPPQPHVLTTAERREARSYNERRFEDPFTIVVARETMGIARYPGSIDDAFIDATAVWQFRHSQTEDGKFGPATTRSVLDAMLAAGNQRFADLLRSDNSVQVIDVAPPAFSGCGGGAGGEPDMMFWWPVRFRTSLRNGFIVQRIENVWNEVGTPPGAWVPVPRYWEAWSVDGAGRVTPVQGTVNDQWGRPRRPATSGAWSMRGQLYTVIDLPARFQGQGAANHARDAGILRSAVALDAATISGLGLPEGFAAIQSGDEGLRRIGGRWDCTNANPALRGHWQTP